MPTLEIVESGNVELYPANGHVIFYGARKRNLLTARMDPAGGLTDARGILSNSRDSDTPITPALSVPLVDIGARGSLELYLEAISATDLDSALPENNYPDGTRVYEIFKAENVRRVTELTVRRIRSQ